MKEKENYINWVKKHKKELVITGLTVAGTILVAKNRTSLKGLLKANEPILKEFIESQQVAKHVVVPELPSDILNNLTGNKLTARALGDKVWCSAQAINKRILAAGLVKRLPSGEYVMTEVGRLLGKDTLKVTAASHTFSNIEWDEKILEVIFSPEELLNIAAKQERARQILRT